jgi:hypothetical protein
MKSAPVLPGERTARGDVLLPSSRATFICRHQARVIVARFQTGSHPERGSNLTLLRVALAGIQRHLSAGIQIIAALVIHPSRWVFSFCCSRVQFLAEPTCCSPKFLSPFSVSVAHERQHTEGSFACPEITNPKSECQRLRV